MTNIENSSEKLKDIINLITSLEDQKKDCSERVKEAYDNANSAGFDPKALKEVIKAIKGDVEEYKHNQDIIAIYLDTLINIKE